MENTDFVIEHIDKEVKVITDRPSSVVNYPANTDFFIENIDDNVISIAHSLNIEASEVEFRPANTDFFIENIDNNVIMIAVSLGLEPSEVTFRPASTDFFVENIDKNLIAIAEYYELEPSRLVLRPANTDMFIENIDRNVTLIKSRTNVITKSGSFITVDVPRGGTMQLTAINGNAEQMTYSGKNKVDSANPTSVNYATVSLSNDIVTVSSTSTVTIPFAIWVIDGLSQNDVIRYSAVIQDNNGQITLQFDNNGRWATINGSVRQYSDGTTAATYSWTNTANTTKARLLLYANKSKPTSSSSSRYKNVILTVNNPDLSFEPYVGGTASPNPDYPQPISTVTGEQTVKVVGKNLLDPNATVLNKYINSSGQEIASASASAGSLLSHTGFIPVTEGQTYTISVTRSTNGSNTGAFNWFTSADLATIMSTRDTYQIETTSTYYMATATAPAHAKYLIVNFIVGGENQLEAGSTATAYEPYQRQEFEVDLGSIGLAKIGDYQDYIYKSGDDWYVHKAINKVILNGSEAWSTFSGRNGTFYITKRDIMLASSTTATPNVISNYYEPKPFDSLYKMTVDYGIANHNAQYWIAIRNKDYSDASSFKTWLASNNTTVYYVLATPTDTQIADATLLEQLNFVAALYEGFNNISLIGTGAQGTIEVVINKDR